MGAVGRDIPGIAFRPGRQIVDTRVADLDEEVAIAKEFRCCAKSYPQDDDPGMVELCTKSRDHAGRCGPEAHRAAGVEL